MGLLLAAAGVRAQEQDDTARRLDSLQRVVTELTSNVQTLETEDLNQAIWKDRAKYFNIGYVNQTMTDKTFGGELKSDFGVSLSNGKTYYLHKKPLLGDDQGSVWTSRGWISTMRNPRWRATTARLARTDVHQAEIGMQVGPSVTINPVHHLKVGGYFRVTPSYSMLYMDDTFHHHYVTMLNAGCMVCLEGDFAGSRVALGLGDVRRPDVRRVGL